MRMFVKSTRNLPMINMVIIDDASTDATATIVNNFIQSHPNSRISLLRRHAPNAQLGKGTALNWAFRQIIQQNLASKANLICGVLDADAYMTSKGYKKVLQYFSANPELALLQTRVAMIEKHNWLQIMQDIEFTVVNYWIQNLRNRISNAAASGNGQFIRVSEVDSLQPWGNALLEDFEFSTRFLLKGKKTVFTGDIVVYQEAVDKVLPFIKQRTRWTQGGLDCLFSYWPKILASNFISRTAKVEMSFYMMIPFITLITGIANILTFSYITLNADDYWQLFVVLIMVNLALNIYIAFLYVKLANYRNWMILSIIVLTLVFYNYLLYPVLVMAFYKKISGQHTWVKTVHGKATVTQENSQN